MASAAWESVGKWRLPAALVVAVLVAGGCGSVHSDRELAAAEGRPAAAASALPAAPEGATAAEAGAASAAPAASGETAPSPAGPGPATPTAGANTAAAPGASKAGAATAGGSGAKGTASPGSGSGSGRASAAPGTPTTPVGGPKPDIVLGEIGSMSGLLGQGLAPTVHAARAWAADVNARGGLNGHRVRVVTGDDGGDPGRALALARRMVDEDHVSALYAHSMVMTLQAVTPFLEERKIPLIGGCNCAPPGAKSPMVFEVGAGPELGVAFGFVLPLVAYSQEKKISVIYCREASACASGAELVRKRVAPALGLQIVHEAQGSFAQPDFTAEVLAARNAGAKGIIVYMDNPSLLRIKRAAKRQGWDPLISTAWASLDERFVKDGGEDTEGVLVSSPTAIWSSPRMADYVAAMGRHVPGGIKAGVGLPAWAGGKLLERVAGSFPAGAVTPADILRGLYSLKNETLGGIVPPATFREGQPPTEHMCVIVTRVEKGRFVPKDGDNYFCPAKTG